MKTTIVWLGRDLRLADNPALKEAAAAGKIVPVFIWSPGEEGDWAPGAASRWWLHRSLEALDRDLRRRGARLIVRRGPTAKALVEAARECGATAVSWNRRWEPAARAVEARVVAALRTAGIEESAHGGNLLFAPDAVKSLTGGPYRVFTPYWNRCGALAVPAAPCGEAGALRRPAKFPKSVALEGLGLLPKRSWDAGLAEAFTPGEAGARAALKTFLRGPVESYAQARNIPALPGTARLSPRLHFGELSVHRAWKEAAGGDPAAKGGFLGELGWRDFAHHVLHHYPETPEAPLNARFRSFAWRRDPAGLEAWKRGLTGYPLVDAGMRQLWATGWMHNRVRMVVASFLTKDLLVDWREGAAWFWDTLVDASLANNTLGWQWAAGCGADAAPFFRIFNPTEQGRRWDPEGEYIRRWLPELARLSAADIHAPWEAAPLDLAAAGVILGESYPWPIVDHKAARIRALGIAGGRPV